MSFATRLFVEFIAGEDPCITEEHEAHIGEFLERHAIAEPDDAEAGKGLLDQLEETLVNFGEEQFINLPSFLVEHLFEFAAAYLPRSSFAVLIMGETFRQTRIREFRNGTQIFSQGPFSDA